MIYGNKSKCRIPWASLLLVACNKNFIRHNFLQNAPSFEILESVEQCSFGLVLLLPCYLHLAGWMGAET
jgi:hypothetical protein